MVWPSVPVLIVASMTIVTESLAGTTPFQVTVLVPVLARFARAATVGATLTVSVKTDLRTANEGFEHETVPLSPAAGVVHDHPLTSGIETKVVPGGSVSLHEALAAASGPLLLTVIV